MIIAASRGKRVWAAMSGGVDSAVAAGLLVREGYAVEGLFMDLWDCRLLERRGRGSCCSPRDERDARELARALGIPFRVVDLQAAFRTEVMEQFVAAYREGLTPNPCIRCNQRIKFGLLLDMAREAGVDFLATGHYAVKARDPGGGPFRLRRGADPDKDQSYFLFPLGQAQMASILWPVGRLSKARVRALARQWGLCVAQKAESQELCFIPDHDYRGFLASYLGDDAGGRGEVVDSAGAVLGTHGGVCGFTVGQRRGLRVPWKEPLYVLRLLPEERRVVVGPRRELAGGVLEAEEVSWVLGEPPARVFEARARIRYRHREAPATVTVLEHGRIGVRFQTPQHAIAPGQAVVLYQGDEVLGGGWISRSAAPRGPARQWDAEAEG
jgi:tRNA-specific 2-thiouridylase